MITREDIINTNKLFDKGIIVNEGSLDFALSSIKSTKDWNKQLAYAIRAILIDHVFEEGNKRTASALIAGVMESQKIEYDLYKIDEIVLKILKDNTTGINKIRRLIKDATII